MEIHHISYSSSYVGYIYFLAIWKSESKYKYGVYTKQKSSSNSLCYFNDDQGLA